MTLLSVRKVYQGIADRRQMFRMFDRHAQRPDRFQDDASALYGGEWFEISEAEHDCMFEILPPLWMRGEMFALREFLTDRITSIFYALNIDGRLRYFHGYCDLLDKGSPERMRDAIVERETRPVRAMTREERLEHIWSSTHDDYRGYAGERWPERDRSRRTVMFYGGRHGTTLKLLDELTDDEIAAKLPVHLRYLPEAIAA
ncbi:MULTISPECIES: DUF1419 domain-containing protein [Mesorhizobium]|uniref:DUF1419 domain-containing protein n=1 Tax=Mesorhizobium mediterraneum TaxID=43617 RepID=A0AB36R1V4_9HYPH|nr:MULTISPECIES: DUF1419 domain-containing protein [Mesorhizobium]PAP98684.1 hypothetical protein CIT25_29890 [Mesorhizobium mediterraneum]RVD09096.1 DUF1419 domain-containing protein [Mesorhizobium sp. M7A.F.Ca.ET.027.02.1.1]RWC24061.1 MAG: DUF1419 domain-containing protein [Mesorhizobium sp.]RWD06222.1 MAG: DUF1419 domain-containing protein [Mesorhizobium sp.]RWN22720.1 MAG: DUF1419 domain-containing protein [Mesorhizobium sp.]